MDLNSLSIRLILSFKGYHKKCVFKKKIYIKMTEDCLGFFASYFLKG